jgi:hypothetical protein
MPGLEKRLARYPRLDPAASRFLRYAIRSRLMRATLIVIAVISVAATSSTTALAHPRRPFTRCHRNLHVTAGRSGNPFLETDIAVKRMSCASAYRAIRHLPATLLSGSVLHGRAHGYFCVVRGSGQPSETVCTQRASTYRFDSYSD